MTLALVALDILNISADLVETLIPITIIITAIFNLVNPSENLESTTFSKTMWQYYVIALGFGLIHGMGFSSYFSSLLGGEESIIFPLFAFNLGNRGWATIDRARHSIDRLYRHERIENETDQLDSFCIRSSSGNCNDYLN